MMLHMRVYNWCYSALFSALFGRVFGQFGKRVRIISPIAIEGPSNIYLGDDVTVGAQSCLAAVPLTGQKTCRLELGDGCKIGRFNHIYATGRISLGDNVLTANNVYISDNTHDFQDTNLPVLGQGVSQKGAVDIGSGSWLGHNSCVLGARIGRNCVVAANSVVIHDVPDFCVVAGSPARVVKRFNPISGCWERVSTLTESERVGSGVRAVPNARQIVS